MDWKHHSPSRHTLLAARASIIRAVRDFFHGEGFLEVQTPLVTRSPAPEPHIDAVTVESGKYLATSPELFMKRLLASGFDKIFQIAPVFRKGERGRIHHPEFTMLEWYRLHADYGDLQGDCRRLLESVHDAMLNDSQGQWAEDRSALKEPWDVYTVRDAFSRFAGWTPGPDTDQEAFEVALVEKVEPRLGFPSPCILKDYPANQAALARLKPQDPSVAERFELYWKGIELANGFSELTDPREQRERFEAANALRVRNGLLPYPMPEEFLETLTELPPCAGIAMGVDRLVMVLTGAPDLDAVVAFPPACP
ncbi:MAG: EF-P lysine aminoacylase GenX [Deltaproteobacteria bacterium]|nr:EF-P lysine aminoacylase GenX [Deltaproteobacteria bacterium]